MTEPAPLEHLRALERDYGRGVWRDYERTIELGRSGGLRWPGHILAPMGAAHGLAMDATGDPSRAASDCARIAALTAWRVTKGIYRYDDELRASLESTSLDRELPGDVLLRMPEWCIYIDLGAGAVRGVYVHHEVDAGDGRYELRLLLDLGSGALAGVPLHIGRPGAWRSVAAALDAARDESIARAALSRGSSAASSLLRDVSAPEYDRELRGIVDRIIPLVLYLCTDEPDLRADDDVSRRPARPRGRAVGAQRVTTWDVGWRLGAALRRARERAESEPRGGEHASPIGHVRRAHWHTYWMGSEQRGDRRRDLRWLAPILVGLDLDGELAAVVRRVT